MNQFNRLQHETSPYLLQHAHNPVNWHPWSSEAFQQAAAEDKPVFLSIGYSTCHWCHVMAEESFESQRMAKALNENFISIKVDREERPDVDHVYMRACQLVTGSGGWPMSIFMTPDKKPFFAGTYFPPGTFLRLIRHIASKWQKDRQPLLDSADEIQEALKQMDAAWQNGRTTEKTDDGSHEKTAEELLRKALSHFRTAFDAENGGFGSAPKFPSPHNLMLLLSHSSHMAEKTLLQMYKGGIFDHIGGGFCRYSTDERWLAPHFEKMLYDNALLAIAYTLAYTVTQKEFFKVPVESALCWMRQEMQSPEGGFYSAQDADIDGKEGAYYLFTPEEIEKVLGKEKGTHFCQQYDITVHGNFEGKNVPNLLKTAKDTDPALFFIRETLKTSIGKLYDYRQIRHTLHRDEKILTGWNSLAAAALAFAGRTFHNKEWVAAAERTLSFLKQQLFDSGRLFSSYTAGKREVPAFLDDYAFYILALLQLYKATGKETYLTQAADMALQAIEQFWDEAHHGFFFSGSSNETLIAPVKETYDGAIPSGNSVMAYNLVQLQHLIQPSETVLSTASETASSPSIQKSHRLLLSDILQKHLQFMDAQADIHPAGHSFYLFSLFPAKKTACEDGVCRLTGEDIF